MGLVRMDDPIIRHVAEVVIEVARTGHRDSNKIAAGAMALIMSRPKIL